MTSEEAIDRSLATRFRCPTCGAEQEPADVCRRCRCDLTLYRQVACAVDARRPHRLVALRDGLPCDALRHARQLYDLAPTTLSAKLLSVSHLLAGNWLAALSYSKAVDE